MPIEMGVDNQSAIAVSYNPEHLQRVKHMERRHFFVREMVEQGHIRVPFVGTADNLADFFTKPLPARQFLALRARIMNEEAPVGAWGGVVANPGSESGNAKYVSAPECPPVRV